MEQASLNIGTIGQRLESARQAKGVSVSEAGRATKILSKFIEAMESDDFGALSAPVYAKSFIRMYARYLGVDASPLVEEYVVQHAPRNKTTMSDEVRQNLAKADRLPVDAGSVPEPSAPRSNRGKTIFGDVNAAVNGVSDTKFPFKLLLSILAGLVLISIIVLAVSQCSEEEAEPSTAGGAAMVEHAVIEDGVPNAYLTRPGVVEVDRN